MHTVDILIVVIYLTFCLLIALFKAKSIKTLKEYTIGRGYFPNVVIIATLFATYIGAGSVIGGIERVYTVGMIYVIARLLSPLFWLFAAKIYGENIDQFRGCLSVSDIMTLLYGRIGRWVTNIISLLTSLGVITIQAVAMGHIMSHYFEISYNHGVIVTVLTLALYSSLGGIGAVAFTDVFQFAVIIIALPLAFSFVYHDIGGYRGIVNSLPDDMITLDINKENACSVLSMTLFNVFPVATGLFIQRFLMCRDSIQLTYCLNVAAVISFFFAVIICMIGLILKIKEPDMEPHIVFINYIMDHIAIGFKGLVIAGLLAVIMSTADSWLNTTSVLLTYDIFSKIMHLNERQALLFARILTFFIGMFVIVIALSQNRLIQLCWITANFWVPTIFIPLSAGFLKFRTNSKSLIAGMVCAIFSIALSTYMMRGLVNISWMCGMIGNALGFFGMHCWQVHQGVLNVHTQSNN